MEVEILPACAAFGIGVAVYSPTGRGLLSGKYAEGELPPPDSRGAVSDRRFLQTVFYPEAMEAASRIADYARGRGTEPSAFAVAWVLANPIVTGAVVGPRNMEQWDTYLKALAFEWSNEDERFVSAIVPPGCTAVRHYVDPQYPIEGRPLPV
jgi:aryl-alcohol dehydrogenase-like predicted oxidoreductase